MRVFARVEFIGWLPPLDVGGIIAACSVELNHIFMIKQRIRNRPGRASAALGYAVGQRLVGGMSRHGA